MQSQTLLLINGPNLNLLGLREPSIYGHATLADIVAATRRHAEMRNARLLDFQSNIEGELVARLHACHAENISGVIINPGAYTHTSVALRDAISAIKIPCIEVHLSNIHARENFRHTSLTAAVCAGVIAGLGPLGCRLAVDALLQQ
jgi:3-dehydroquinate dehydratase-2